MQDVDVLRK